MLKKLRIKFVALTMVIVTLVLTVAFSTICFVESQRANDNLQNAMQTLIDRAAADTMAGEAAKQPQDAATDKGAQNAIDAEKDKQAPAQATQDDAVQPANDGKQAADPKAKGADADAPAGPRIGGPDRDKTDRYPIALYTLNADGELDALDSWTTASIADDVLASAQTSIVNAADGYGNIGAAGLRYLKCDVAGTTFVAFADSANADGWKSLALTLLLVGGAALAVFFVLSLLFSKWALRPVEESWEAQRRFVTDASHELKTPLTVILANTSILLSHPERSIANESKWLESTQIEAQRMQGLVGEMLTLAQVEACGEETPRISEKVDFSDIVAGQTLEFESVAFEQGFALKSDIAEGIEVAGDPERLRKLSSTLIENASKYVNAGGTVAVNLSRKGKMAKLDVSNTGSFIEDDDLAHVFDRFYRSDKARSSETGGFGLGLSIAREIAKSHSGDITVESSREAGTRFTATIPLA